MPTTRLFELAAPAKVNLGLRIVGVRDDGLHLLESIFAPLDLHDDVHLEIRERDAGAECSVELELLPDDEGRPASPDVPRDHRNLAVRAAQAFLDAAGLAARARISLRKRIPSAAGLGGGSSDAAAVLRALSELWPGRLEAARIEALALDLGADVPFFLDPRPALVTGVGEIRAPLGDWPELALVLANPLRAVSTAEVFRAWDEGSASTPPGQLERDLERVRRSGAPVTDVAAAWGALLHNDLGPAAEGLCPEIGMLRARLGEVGAVATGQSGSGATVFGVFPDAARARAARELLSANDSGWFRVAISLGAR